MATDRRSDREVLNEIAACDSNRILISRNTPALASSIEQQLPIPTTSTALVLVEPATSVSRLDLALTAGWPGGAGLLVAAPESFALIAVHGLTPAQRSAAQAAESLGAWLIRLWQAGAVPVRQPSDNGWDLPPLRETSTRRKLIPPFPALTESWRSVISRLADFRFPANNSDAIALKAGLFQWHDALNESHECSQVIEGQGRHHAGDYWHAIMHRREPDYGNSKYWFRHVGRHPIFAELGQRVAPLIEADAPDWRDRLLRDGWDPCAFVDFCEIAVRQRNASHVELAETIQEIEMLLLLASTYADASKG
ncbi:MAG: hypothetical protein U0872_10595 [Planctomycetaceae bacterium]